MPIIGGARGMIDLPGFDRVAVVASEHGESARLRGSAARRLVQRLLTQGEIDHTLPAVCSPPPFDLDLLFSSDDSEQLASMLRAIRDSAPIFQAVRVEASSMPRIQSLADEVDAYIDCPVFGISMGDFDDEGFRDESGRGIQQLADRRLTFNFENGAGDQALDDDVQFQLYCAGLVFAKAAQEHGSFQDFLNSPAPEFCGARRSLARRLATPPDSQVTEETGYYRARLYGIAYSLRAIFPPGDFRDHIAPLLPRRVARLVSGSGPLAPMFNLGKSEIFEAEQDWQPTRSAWVQNSVDLSHAEPLMSSPAIALPPGMIEGCTLECLIPMTRAQARTEPYSTAGSAAIELIVRSGRERQILWLPAPCTVQVRGTVASLRIGLDQAAWIVNEANNILGAAEGSVVIHVMATGTEQQEIDVAEAEADEDYDNAPEAETLEPDPASEAGYERGYEGGYEQ